MATITAIDVTLYCDKCENTDTVSVYIDLEQLSAATNYRFMQKTLKSVKKEAHEWGQENGWLINKGYTFCPDCADSNDLPIPKMATNAKGLLRETAYFISENRKNKQD